MESMRSTDPAGFRINLTSSCTDCDSLPRDINAGKIIEVNSNKVQVMHNGLLIHAGCYFGDWMTQIISNLRGVHEPQEEFVFNQLLHYIKSSESAVKSPVIVELGSFWAYYSMWFLKVIPNGQAVMLEPDCRRLQIGKSNFELNGLRGTFLHGVIGNENADEIEFLLEEDNTITRVRQFSLEELLKQTDSNQIDILMCDIQGAEEFLFENESEFLKNKKIRFALISTHHKSISGSWTTHQDLLELLVELGGHIICEHSVAESFSGDGLIAVSFWPEDINLNIKVSHARTVESLFEPLETELNRLEQLLMESNFKLDLVLCDINNLKRSKSWLITSPFRRINIFIKRFFRLY